jgi:hypothetical protein
MDEMIEITVEKVVNSLDGYSLTERYFMLLAIYRKLKDAAHSCLCVEYGLTDEENI